MDQPWEDGGDLLEVELAAAYGWRPKRRVAHRQQVCAFCELPLMVWEQQWWHVDRPGYYLLDCARATARL